MSFRRSAFPGNFRKFLEISGGRRSAVGGRLRSAVGLPPPEVKFPWKFPETWFLSRGQISKRISRHLCQGQSRLPPVSFYRCGLWRSASTVGVVGFGWMVVRFVRVIRLPGAPVSRMSRVSRVCQKSPHRHTFTFTQTFHTPRRVRASSSPWACRPFKPPPCVSRLRGGRPPAVSFYLAHHTVRPVYADSGPA